MSGKRRVGMVQRLVRTLAAQATRGRLFILGTLLLPISIILEVALIWSDPANRWRFPLGHDYVAFWTAAQLYAEGGLPRLYDLSAFEALQNLHAVRPGLLLWLYPPLYLILILPLAAVSFVIGYLLFTAINLGAIAAVFSRIRPFDGAVGWAALLGSPVIVGSIVQGQNGAFFAACIIGGFVTRARGWHWVAALLFAIVLAKPQYGPLIPVVLLAMGDWKGILRIMLFCIAFILLTTALVGIESWPYFVENSRVLRVFLDEPELLAHMPTIWAAATLGGFGGGSALALHGFVAVLSIGLVWWIWSQKTVSADVKLASLLFGTLLITPYAYRYDMVLTLGGTLLLMRIGSRAGFRPVAKLIVATLWIWPALFTPIALATWVQTGPLISMAGLLLCVHYAKVNLRDGQGSGELKRDAALA